MSYTKPEFTDEEFITIGEANRRREFALLSKELTDRIADLESAVREQAVMIENIEKYLEKLQ